MDKIRSITLFKDYFTEFYKAQAFPTTYFFNEKGEVIGEPIVGAATNDYASLMNEYLGK